MKRLRSENQELQKVSCIATKEQVLEVVRVHAESGQFSRGARCHTCQREEAEIRNSQAKESHFKWPTGM